MRTRPHSRLTPAPLPPENRGKKSLREVRAQARRAEVGNFLLYSFGEPIKRIERSIGQEMFSFALSPHRVAWSFRCLGALRERIFL